MIVALASKRSEIAKGWNPPVAGTSIVFKCPVRQSRPSDRCPNALILPGTSPLPSSNYWTSGTVAARSYLITARILFSICR